MWNNRKYAAMAIGGIGLAIAAATPASAQYGGTYGPASSGNFGDYGYAGVYSYGWPYATYGLAGYGGSGDYGFGYRPGGYGGAYGAAVSAPYAGWGTHYGIYGFAPSYGYAGYPFDGRARNRGFERARGFRYGYGAGDRVPYVRTFAASAPVKIVYRHQAPKLTRVE